MPENQIYCNTHGGKREGAGRPVKENTKAAKLQAVEVRRLMSEIDITDKQPLDVMLIAMDIYRKVGNLEKS